MSAEVMNRVIKRNGEEVIFDLSKIVNAIEKANHEVNNIHKLNEYQILAVADNVADKINESTHGGNRDHGDAGL